MPLHLTATSPSALPRRRAAASFVIVGQAAFLCKHALKGRGTKERLVGACMPPCLRWLTQPLSPST